jgi:hypothetical protein
VALAASHFTEGLRLLTQFGKIGEGKTGGGDSLLTLDLEDIEELLGVGIRERFQEDSVNDAKNRGVGADAQSQGEDRQRGEAGIFAEGAKSVARVLYEGFEHRKASLFAVRFLELGCTA